MRKITVLKPEKNFQSGIVGCWIDLALLGFFDSSIVPVLTANRESHRQRQKIKVESHYRKKGGEGGAEIKKKNRKSRRLRKTPAN